MFIYSLFRQPGLLTSLNVIKLTLKTSILTPMSYSLTVTHPDTSCFQDVKIKVRAKHAQSQLRYYHRLLYTMKISLERREFLMVHVCEFIINIEMFKSNFFLLQMFFQQTLLRSSHVIQLQAYESACNR